MVVFGLKCSAWRARLFWRGGGWVKVERPAGRTTLTPPPPRLTVVDARPRLVLSRCAVMQRAPRLIFVLGYRLDPAT